MAEFKNRFKKMVGQHRQRLARILLHIRQFDVVDGDDAVLFFFVQIFIFDRRLSCVCLSERKNRSHH